MSGAWPWGGGGGKSREREQSRQSHGGMRDGSVGCCPWCPGLGCERGSGALAGGMGGGHVLAGPELWAFSRWGFPEDYWELWHRNCSTRCPSSPSSLGADFFFMDCVSVQAGDLLPDAM